MSRLSGRVENKSASEDSTGQPQRRANVNSERNRRLMAGIQSALGGSQLDRVPLSRTKEGRSSRDRPRRSQRNVEIDPVEELKDVESIIKQISDLSLRSDRSAAQIKRNIRASKFVSAMDEDEWQEVCEALINTALDHGETDFVVDLFVSLIENPEFCEVVSDELMRVASAHVIHGGSKPVPAFLSAILCGNWPRHLAKAIDSVNLVVYTTVCIIKGWIQVIEDDNKFFYKPEPKKQQLPKEEESDEESTSEVEPPAEEQEPEKEDPEIVNRCAEGIFDFCESAQRSLWMRWPTICDEIYGCVKPAITHNQTLNGETKTKLLHTLLMINSWTKSRAVTTKSAQTQTC